MSGRRHHILPKFLLKGFPANARKEQIYTWLYAAGRAPVSTNILNVSVEGDFYGAPGEKIQADDAISKIEQMYAPLVKDLREMPAGKVTDSRVGSFTAHISARTKHLRLTFEECTKQLLDEIERKVSDPVHFGELLLARALEDEYLQEQLLANLPLEFRTAGVAEKLTPLLRDAFPIMVEKNREYFSRIAAAMVRNLRPMLGIAVMNGQNEALVRMQLDTPRAEIFQALNWHIEDCVAPLILGDSAYLFSQRGDPVLRPYPEDPKNVALVILPLAPNRLLVGCDELSSSTPSVEILNVASARCSREYYISSREPNVHGKYQSIIGQGAIFFTHEQVIEITKGFLSLRKK